MDRDFLRLLDEMREYADIPFIIRSAMRCKRHNAEVGGVKNSAHLRGYAVDLKVSGSRARFKIIDSALHFGVTRIGLYPHLPHLIHIDVDPNKDPNVVWFK